MKTFQCTYTILHKMEFKFVKFYNNYIVESKNLK